MFSVFVPYLGIYKLLPMFFLNSIYAPLQTLSLYGVSAKMQFLKKTHGVSKILRQWLTSQGMLVGTERNERFLLTRAGRDFFTCCVCVCSRVRDQASSITLSCELQGGEMFLGAALRIPLERPKCLSQLFTIR
ncbi:mCG146947, partial [Mus musculus]